MWLSVTAGLGLLAAARIPALTVAVRTAGTATFDELLVSACELALGLVGCWLWTVTSVVALDAARGRERDRRGVPLALRRVVLVACGAALAGALATPSYAGHSGRAGDGPHSSSLVQGLPLPDRATAAMHVARLVAREADRDRSPAGAHRSPRPDRTARTIVVAPGDTLWALARASLPASSSPASIAEQVRALHDTNRAVIGDDPDLILPGQVLRQPRP